MVPRTEMNIISKEMPAEEALQKMSREKYTRYPVVDGDKDHVIGFVNFKDILLSLYNIKLLIRRQ